MRFFNRRASFAAVHEFRSWHFATIWTLALKCRYWRHSGHASSGQMSLMTQSGLDSRFTRRLAKRLSEERTRAPQNL